jgi:very-short-patch-repair endonuclease
MARTNRRYASERMISNNPMYRQECLEMMRAQLRTIGHRPAVQGGNGRPMPEAQRLMKAALGDAWKAEFVVVTKLRQQGYPNHYKLDLAHPLRKVAIEIDGGSHSARKIRASDRRKELFLRQNGWLVLRFSNEEVMADSAACARMVMSTTSR